MKHIGKIILTLIVLGSVIVPLRRSYAAEGTKPAKTKTIKENVSKTKHVKESSSSNTTGKAAVKTKAKQGAKDAKRSKATKSGVSKDQLDKSATGPHGEAVYSGPKGGKYYMNKNGKKTYMKK